MRHCARFLVIGLLLSFSGLVRADEEATSEPKVIPATRPEIKAALEALKNRTPRLPLPPGSAEGGVNNGRMRSFYLPESWVGGQGGGRRRSPGGGSHTSPKYKLETSCFWIVSRGNNCHFCLGHQEMKLRSAGLEDDTVAALDCDWSQFDPKTQAALGFARKLTLAPRTVRFKTMRGMWYSAGHALHRLHAEGGKLQDVLAPETSTFKPKVRTAAHHLAAKLTATPHLISDLDIAEVRKNSTDAETAEIVQFICIANMFDRFTEALGLPLEAELANNPL